MRQPFGMPARRVAASALVLLALQGCATIRDAPGLNLIFGDDPISLDPTAEAGIPYEVAITGLGVGETDEETAENQRMLAVIEEAARIYKLSDKPPANLPLLRRRAAADVDIVERALRSEGYYEGEASIRVEDQGESEESEDGALVRVAVRKGPRYSLARQDVALANPIEPDALEALRETLTQNVSGPATGRAVVDAENEGLALLRREGWPYAQRGKRRAEANFDFDTVDVLTRIAPGPLTLYGPVTITGNGGVELDYVEGFITWQQGEPVNRDTIREVQKELAATRLFDAVSINLPEAPPEGLEAGAPFNAPIEVVLEEAKHRTVSAGLSYSTAEGAGGTAGWEHRNLYGRGEQLRLGAEVAQTRQALDITGRIPRFGSPHRDLVGNAEFFNEETDAFDIFGVEAGIGFEERFSDTLSGTLGIGVEASQTTTKGVAKNTFLLGLPGTLVYDATDDRLNPTEGARASALVAPWAGLFDDEPTGFVVADLEGSAYYALDRKANYILAGRARTAAIFSEGRDSVPTHRQLFSGGGGSVRAFGTQRVNELDNEDTPIGALSVAEVSAEFRARYGSFGVVPFVDAGIVSQELFSDFEEIRWGGGVGLRYFSPVGPIRVDVAVPFNRRDADDTYQLYLSIGQAF